MKNKVFFLIQALLRYFPYKLGVWLRSVLYRPFFKKLGNNTRIFDAVIIKYPNDIEIGDNVTINQFCYLVGKGGLTIGNDTMIGAGSKIVTSSHGFEDTSTPMRMQPITFLPIIIEEDVWLGFDVVIMAGTVIRKGSIVGAKSLVLKADYDQFSVLGGVPAKLIKKRV